MILARALQVALDEFMERRALRVIAAAIRLIPADVLIARVAWAREQRQAAENDAIHEWQTAAAVVLQVTLIAPLPMPPRVRYALWRCRRRRGVDD